MQEANQGRIESPKTVDTDADEGRKQTILLVEDEEMLRALLCEALELEGYKVISCSHPKEGIEASQRHGGEIDLLLTDVVMPGMNGLAMAKMIKKIIPELRVVFMSGYTEHALSDGEIDSQFEYLQKPFTLLRLRQKLARVLG
jgi:DNA-binding NtrC family response regulator